MKNGWAKWLASCLWGILIAVLMFMGNTIKANDEASRGRDIAITEKMEVIKDEQNGKLDSIKTEQMKKFTDILVAIAELKKDVERIQ